MKKVTRQVLTNTHTQGVCGRELTDSPAVRVPHSLTIDAKYVFIFQTLSLSLILL